MSIFYHGTSIENAEQILLSGFGGGDRTVWYPSNRDYVYVREELPPEAGEDTYSLTVHSAFTTAAVLNSQQNSVAIFRLEIPDNLEEIVEPDDSIEFDENSYQIEAKQLNALISSGKVKLDCRILEGYMPELRSFVLAYSNLPQINLADDIKKEIRTVARPCLDNLVCSVYDWIESKIVPWVELEPMSDIANETKYFGG